MKKIIIYTLSIIFFQSCSIMIPLKDLPKPDGEFLVGKVVEVNFTTARVLLLSDLNSKIPVTIEPEGYQSILSGTGKNDGVIQYSKEEILLDSGNTVYTSGSGAIFKSGIPIGKIKGKRSVNYLSDFSQLRFVKIISFETEV